jgi:D-alanyl-D-alanine carboxypeptidase
MTLRSKYFGFLALALGLAVPVTRAETSEAKQIQAALESWVAERASAEKITGVAAYVSFGDPGPAIEAFAGKTGRDPQDPPVRQNTLFQMGSTAITIRTPTTSSRP